MRLRVILPSLREVYPDREVELRTNTLQKFCGSRTDLEIGFPAGGVATYKKSLTWKDFEKTIPEYLGLVDPGCGVRPVGLRCGPADHRPFCHDRAQRFPDEGSL